MSDASQNTYDANYPGKQPAEAVEADDEAVTYLDTLHSPKEALDRRWAAWAQDDEGDENGEPTYWYGETEIAAAEAARVGLGVALVVYAPYPGIRVKLG